MLVTLKLFFQGPPHRQSRTKRNELFLNAADRRHHRFGALAPSATVGPITIALIDRRMRQFSIRVVLSARYCTGRAGIGIGG